MLPQFQEVHYEATILLLRQFKTGRGRFLSFLVLEGWLLNIEYRVLESLRQNTYRSTSFPYFEKRSFIIYKNTKH